MIFILIAIIIANLLENSLAAKANCTFRNGILGISDNKAQPLGVLSNNSIQMRYLNSCRKTPFVIPRFLLLSQDHQVYSH